MRLVIFACILEMTNRGTHLEESILNPHTDGGTCLQSSVRWPCARQFSTRKSLDIWYPACVVWMHRLNAWKWHITVETCGIPTITSCWSPEQERGSHSMTPLDWRLGQLQYPGSLTNLLRWLAALQSVIEKEHFRILGQLQPKPQSNVLSNHNTNPRCVHLLYTSQAIFVRCSYLAPHSICSKKIKALIVIDTEYSNVSLPFSVSCDDFY